MWLHRLQSLNYYIFDTVHDSLEVDSDLIEVVFELGQIPLWCILPIIVLIIILLPTIRSCVFDIVFILLIYRVVGKMDVPLVDIFLIICVFLCSKTSKTFLK